MADFFNRNINEDNVRKFESMANESHAAANVKAQEDINKRNENYNRYGITVSDAIYEEMNKAIANSEDPEETAHRFGTAYKYSQMFGISFSEAFEKQDEYNAAFWGSEKQQPAKAWYKAVSDALAMGNNNCKIGSLGLEVMQAEANGDEEKLKVLMDSYNALKQDNETRYDSTPRTWAVEALKAGAESLPFTAYSAGAGMFGNFIAPVAGTAAAFAVSANITMGQEYLDLREEGASPELAARVAAISGGIQGGIEVALGNVLGIAGAVAGKAGKAATRSLTNTAAEKIAQNVAKRFHFGPGKKLAVKLAGEYISDVLGEGAEEGLQELTSIISHDIAAELGDYDYDEKTATEVAGQIAEAFKGGILGSIVLSGLPVAINSTATIKDYQTVKNAADEIPSKEMFKNVAKNTEEGKNVFEHFPEDKRDAIINQVWESAQETRNKRDADIVASTNETTAFSENMEAEPEEDENGEQLNVPAFRTEEGKLYTNNEVNTDEDGKASGAFTFGNGNAENKNLYGYINYDIDDENSIVTIKDFKTTAYRRSLAAEAFDEFAQQYAGYEIKWEPTGKGGKALKEALINKNASGKNNGLSYYKDQNALLDLEQRKKVNDELRKNIPTLTADERAAAVSLLEAGSRRQGYSLRDYVQNTFGSSIFESSYNEGNNARLVRGLIETEAKNKNVDIQEYLKENYGVNDFSEIDEETSQSILKNKMKGATSWKKYGNEVKAVIYAGKYADFSTWSHELAHIWQAQLTGDLKAQAEKAFNVKDGDWNNSMFVFADGHTESSAEAFARGFEDYLRTGKAPNAEMKNIFQRFAAYMAQVYRNLKGFIELSPEITSVYDELLKADDSILAAAENAVEQSDKEYRARRSVDEGKKTDEARKQQESKEENKTSEKEDLEDVTLEAEETEPDYTIEPEPEETVEEDTVSMYDTLKKADYNFNSPRKYAAYIAMSSVLEDLYHRPLNDGTEITAEQAARAFKRVLADPQYKSDFDLFYADTAGDQVFMSDNYAPTVEKIGQAIADEAWSIAHNVLTKEQESSEWLAEIGDFFTEMGEELIKEEQAKQNIEQSLNNLSYAKEVAEIITSDEKTITEKQTAALKAAGEQADEIPEDIFQTVTYAAIQNMNDVKEKARRNNSLWQAIQFAEGLKESNMPDEMIARRVKLLTNWEKNNLGDWVYEIDDNTIQFKNIDIKDQLSYMLSKAQNTKKSKLMSMNSLIDAGEIYELYPFTKTIPVNFVFDDNLNRRSSFGESGIEINVLRMNDLADIRRTILFNLQLAISFSDYVNDKNKTDWPKVINAIQKDALNTYRRINLKAYDRQRRCIYDSAYYPMDINYQVIGEIGAKKIDDYDKITTRTEALETARQMYDAGKDAKTIRLATGWELAKDGLWRYEIQDAKLNDIHNVELLSDTPVFKMTTLGRLIDAPELFKAYPIFKDMFVSFKKLDNSVRGQYNTNQVFVDLDMSLYDDLIDGTTIVEDEVTGEETIELDNFAEAAYSTLLHEIQHAIQEKEGFARGGNPGQFNKSVIDNLIEEENKEKEKLIKIAENVIGTGYYPLSQSQFEKILKNDEYRDSYLYHMDNLKNLEASEKYNRTNGYSTQYEKYLSLAGEVEARNVQERLNFTETERLAKLLSETADVSMADQIVLFQAANEATENGINFQKRTKAEVELAMDELKYFPEEKRKFITGNLERLKNTSWYRAAIETLLIRRDMRSLLNGEKPTARSKLMASNSEGAREALKKGEQGVYEYLCHFGFLGEAEKPGLNVSSTYLNCNASPDCAKHCYALNVRYNYANAAVKRELLSWYIEQQPDKAAIRIAREFMLSPLFEANHALRLLDVGDLSPEWLPVIKVLNDYGVRLQVFSKRPEILRQINQVVSNKINNIIALSIDNSNFEMALDPENKDLPIAFLYSGTKDLELLDKLEDNYKRNGGVILPLKQGKRLLTPEEIKAIPKWAKPHTCPVDKGSVSVKAGWRCYLCDRHGGVGCFYHKTTKYIDYYSKPLNMYTNKNKEQRANDERILREYIESIPDEMQRGQLLSSLVRLLSDTRATNDTSPEKGASQKVGSIYQGESRNVGTGSGSLEGPLNYQIVSEEQIKLRNETQKQETAVRSKYENTAAWLKAPNGEDSNLNEKQWVQVRTDNFKKWFGDWENDPENASKILDENGEPLVVYHGTTENFDVFDATKSRANMDIQGNFFSPWELDAKGYGENVRPFYLNIKNPADSRTGYAALHQFTGQNGAGIKARELLISQGYDGVNNDNEEYIAFNAPQTKSALNNNGMFDSRNENINFQKVIPEDLTPPNLVDVDFTKDDTDEERDTKWEQLEKNHDEKTKYFTDIISDPAFIGLMVKTTDQEYYVHENTKPDKDQYKWQISFFDKLGPWGDAHRDTIESVIKELPSREIVSVQVIWDDKLKYDKPYFDAIEKDDLETAANIAQSYAAKQGYLEDVEPIVTDNTDITIPLTKRFGNKKNYIQQNDVTEEYSLQFQTQDELFNDARSFNSWQDFMEFYENEGMKPEPSIVPNEADASWYKSIWEMARGIEANKPESEGPSDNITQNTMDALFVTELMQPGVLENLLMRVDDLVKTDFNNLPGPADEEELAERERLVFTQEMINKKLTHGSWLSNAARIAKGKALTNQQKNTLLSLIRGAAREYRDIYSLITGSDRFAVPEAERFATQIANEAKKLHKLVKPEDFSEYSPEKMREYAANLKNEEIAQKIRKGTLKMDDELKDYIKNLEQQAKDADKRAEKLKEETEADYKRLNDYATRNLLKVHEEMLKAKAKWNRKKDDIAKKIERGLKVTEKYQADERKAKATYDSVFARWDNLQKVYKLNSDIQEALTRKERYIDTIEEQADIKNDKAILTQLSDMRRKLVKSTMRRVSFDNIDYGNAKKLIAIQRVFQPNLMGGIDKWLGEKPMFVRGLLSEYLTDAELKAKVDTYLSRWQRNGGAKTKEKIAHLKELLKGMKSSDEYNRWTEEERKLATRYLPQNDWIKELKLEELNDERTQSIQLDIHEVTETRLFIGKDKKEHVMTITRPEFSEEIGLMIQDALGLELYDQLVNKPFESWTTGEMEQFARRINDLYTEGRDALAAKRQAQKDQADSIRQKIRESVQDTGIYINSSDTPEEKAAKQAKIDKILGKSTTIKGTLAAKKDKQYGAIGKLLHGYSDANVLRVSRILDNYTEGANYQELYRKEDDCYNRKQRYIRERDTMIRNLMIENGIKVEDLYEVVKVGNKEFTIDELLFIKAANDDYKCKENPVDVAGPDWEKKLANNDDFAPTARNAVMFGNLLSATDELEQIEYWRNLDRDIQEKIKNDELSENEKALFEKKMLDQKPGTSRFIAACHAAMEQTLEAAANLDPKFNKLYEAIAKDYADQFERMNQISIDEFNSPVWRVEKYVPLIRLESNGDTNENRVREDVLAASFDGKNWVDKGMTKKRTQMSPMNQKPIEMGLFKTWVDSVERTEHFIAYAGYVRELNRIYKGRDSQYVRQFIQNRYGRGMIQYIDNYINEVANPAATSAMSDADQLLRVLRGKLAPAYLGWKISGIVKQFCTSPWPYLQFITPQEYLAASMDMLKSKNDLNDLIKAKSEYMNARTMDPIIDLIKEQEEKAVSKAGRKLSQFNDMGMKGLEWIDWACVAPGWLACYRKEYARLEEANNYDVILEGLKEENLRTAPKDRMTNDQLAAAAIEAQLDEDEIELMAVQFADDKTRECQPSSRLADLSPLFKERGKGSEAWRTLLQFQTSLNVIWQNLWYDIPYSVRQKNFRRVIGAIAGYILAGVFMNAVTQGDIAPSGDDDDKDRIAKLRRLIYYATTQFSDAIPVIGGAVSTMNQTLIGGEKFYNSTSDLTPLMTDIKKGTIDAFNGKWDKALKEYAEAAALSTGLPVSGTKELAAAAGIGDDEEGLKFKPQAFAGRRK